MPSRAASKDVFCGQVGHGVHYRCRLLRLAKPSLKHLVILKVRKTESALARCFSMLMNQAIQKFSRWKSFESKKCTSYSYELTLRQFALFIRNKDIESITLDDVMSYFSSMREIGWEDNSFIPKAIALRKFLEFFRKQEVHVLDPWLVPVPSKSYSMPRVATEASFRKLLEVIPTDTTDPRHIRNKAIIQLLWDTGARNGEICSLNESHLDLVQMKAVIKTEKSRGAKPIRELFWTKETNDCLRAWLQTRERLLTSMDVSDDQCIFFSLCNQQAGNRLRVGGLAEMLRRYSNKANLPTVNAHSFRHHMGHHVVIQGGSNSDVSNILGHSSLASSFRYTQMQNEELHDRYLTFMDKSE